MNVNDNYYKFSSIDKRFIKRTNDLFGIDRNLSNRILKVLMVVWCCYNVKLSLVNKNFNVEVYLASNLI